MDAAAFPTLWMAWDSMAEREDLSGGNGLLEADPCVADRKVVELLTEQLERATLTLVNKVDMASPEELATTEQVCAALNPSAPLLRTQYGAAPLSSLLPQSGPAALTSPAAHGTECSPDCSDPSHDHSHSGSSHAAHGTSVQALGFTSFVYSASRPMSHARLMDLVVNRWPLPLKDVLQLTDLRPGAADPSMRSPFEAVLRSKGWMWVDTVPDAPVMWSHAGRHL